MFSVWNDLSDLGDCSQYEPQIQATAARLGIDPAIIRAQLTQESGCQAGVVSSQGAVGLAQFLPSTFSSLGCSGSPSNPSDAFGCYATYMGQLLSQFGGNIRLALAGYHSGPGAAQAALNNCAGNPKTCNYVNTILGKAGVSGDATATDTSGDAASSGFDFTSLVSDPTVLLALGLAAAFFLLRR